MGVADWAKPQETYSSYNFLGSSETRSYFHQHLKSEEFTTFSPQFFFWSMLWFIGFAILNAAWRSGKLGSVASKLSPIRRVQLMFQLLSLIASLLMLGVMVVVTTYGELSTVLYTGSLTHEYSEEKFVDEWSSPPRAVKKASMLMLFAGYAVVPVTTLYVMEILGVSLTISLSPAAATEASRRQATPQSPSSADTDRRMVAETPPPQTIADKPPAARVDSTADDSGSRKDANIGVVMKDSASRRKRSAEGGDSRLSPTDNGSPMSPVVARYPPDNSLAGSTREGEEETAMTRSLLVVFIHHLIVLLLYCMGLSPMFECMDMAYFRMAWILSLHIALEFPCFLAIIAYRVSDNKHLVRRGMEGCAIYTLILRISVNVLAFLSYLDIAWLRLKFTDWDLFWRWTFPWIFIILVLAQLYIVRIYWIIRTKAMMETETLDLSLQRQQLESGRGKEEITSLGDNKVVQLSSAEDGVNAVDGSRERAKSGFSQSSWSSPAAARFTKATSSMMLALEVPASGGRSNNRVMYDKAAAPAGTLMDYYLRLPFKRLTVLAIFFLFLICVLFIWIPFSCETCSIAKQRVAVIGGGPSGLVAAWTLAKTSPNFEITLFEKDNRLGGAAYTSNYVDEDTGVVTGIDLAFRAFIDYYNFEDLIDELGIDVDKEIESLSTGFSSQFNDQKANESVFVTSAEFSRPLAAGKSKYDFHMERVRLRELLEDASATYSEEVLMTKTLGDFLNEHNFSRVFIEVHMKSCLFLYVGTAAKYLSTPLSVILFLEKNVHICTSMDMDGRALTKNFRNGTQVYVERLAARLREDGVTIRTQTEVQKLSPSSRSGLPLRTTKTNVLLNGGQEEEFDHVIIALRVPHLIPLLAASPDSFHALNIPRRLYNTANMEITDVAAVVTAAKNGRHSPIDIISANSLSGTRPSTLIVDDKDSNQTRQCYMFEQCNHFPADIKDDLSTTEPVSIGFQFFDVTKCYDKESMNSVGPFILYAATPLIEKLLNNMKEEFSDASITARFNVTTHTVGFALGARNMHKAQGLHNIWYASADFSSLNLHELAVINGMATAQAIGGRYPDTKNALAVERFLRFQYWLMYGVNPFVARYTERSSRRR